MKIILACAAVRIKVAQEYLKLFILMEDPEPEDFCAAIAMIDHLFRGENLRYLTEKDSYNAKEKARDDTFLLIDEAISLIIISHPEFWENMSCEGQG